MPRYLVHRKSDGEQVYDYTADSAVEWTGMPFAEFDHTEQAEPVPDAQPPVYGGRRRLAHLEFLQLLTAEERIAIRAAAKVSPIIDDYLYLLDNASEIDLDSEAAVGGVTSLEAAGLLAAGRAAEVLNG